MKNIRCSLEDALNALEIKGKERATFIDLMGLQALMASKAVKGKALKPEAREKYKE